MMRSSYCHVAVALVGTLCVSACSDDAASQDTDNGSSSSAGEEETLDTTMTTVDTSSTTPTTADTSTSMPPETSGGECILVPQLFDDNSFEGGPDGPWAWASSAFSTTGPICDGSCGGPSGGSDGSWFVWLGGSTSDTDVAGVAQSVTINAGDTATLTLDIQYGAPVVGDIFQVLVDGNVVLELTDVDAASYTDWTEVEIDVSDYADGSSHDFDFTGAIGVNGSFYFDNVRLETCADGSSNTQGDSVDPPMTGGTTDPTDTDTDTGGLMMCEEDLGSTVPVNQSGNNSGQGNDATGTCTGSNTGEDVAYSFTAPAAGTYSIDTLQSDVTDTVLYVLEDCMGGPEIACNDDLNYPQENRSSLFVTLAQDQTIAIVVDGYDNTFSGDFVLRVQQIACEAPEDLGNNIPIEQDGDNTGAGDDVSNACGGIGGEDVVYTWTPQADGIYAISAISFQFAPTVSAYAGACGDPEDLLSCGSGPNFATFTTAVAADQAISIVVDSNDGDVGTFELDIDLLGTPTGDCCAADDSAGCENITVTQCVCSDIPDCCDSGWSDFCVGYGASNCSSGCALIDGGSCCDEQGTGGCDATAVQDCVCEIDSFCCDTAWDATCVEYGTTYCLADCA